MPQERMPAPQEFTDEELEWIETEAERLKPHYDGDLSTAREVARVSLRGRKYSERRLNSSYTTEEQEKRNPDRT